MTPTSPRFIAIEGLDASGKGTQAALLASALTTAGLSVDTWSFPRYGLFFGNRIKELLAGKDDVSATTLDPSSMALWFATDRWDAINTMADATRKADVILLNRWTLSNAVYQGARCATELDQNQFFDWVLDLEYGHFRLPRPTINIVLEVSVETSMTRARERATSAGDQPDVYELSARLLHNSRRLYRRAADSLPEVQRIEVDGLDVSSVHQKVASLVNDTLR